MSNPAAVWCGEMIYSGLLHGCAATSTRFCSKQHADCAATMPGDCTWSLKHLGIPTCCWLQGVCCLWPGSSCSDCHANLLTCFAQFCFLAKFGLRCWANACNITGSTTCLLQVSACHTVPHISHDFLLAEDPWNRSHFCTVLSSWGFPAIIHDAPAASCPSHVGYTCTAAKSSIWVSVRHVAVCRAVV